MMHQAARHCIAWSFQVAQGRTNEAVLLAAAAGDIIAMARRFGPHGQASGFGRRVRLIAERAPGPLLLAGERTAGRSAEPTSELPSLMRCSYAVFCLEQQIMNPVTAHISAEQTTDRQCLS